MGVNDGTNVGLSIGANIIVGVSDGANVGLSVVARLVQV